MKPNTFCICIPTLNRLDLLLPSLLHYTTFDFPNTEIIIYDNGKQLIQDKLHGISNLRGCRSLYKRLLDNITVLGGKEGNIGVSAAWNILCNKAFEKHSHVLLLNDDIYLGRTEHDITGLINNERYVSDFYVSEPNYDWSAFILPKTTFDRVGEFDEVLSIYYQDSDYNVRMVIAGCDFFNKPYRIPFLNPVLFKRSQSLMKDASLNEKIKRNKEYYIKKWGGDVGSETFKTPFGA